MSGSRAGGAWRRVAALAVAGGGALGMFAIPQAMPAQAAVPNT